MAFGTYPAQHMGTEVWEPSVFLWVAKGMKETKFKRRERKSREAGRETAAEAGSVKESMQM